MTVAEIERIGAPDITRADARKAFLDYRRAVGTERDPARRKEYEGLMRGYKAIAKGQQVIDLAQTMKTAGVQEDTLYPRLAICRANENRCRVEMKQDGACVFMGWNDTDRFRRIAKARRVTLPVGTLPPFVAVWKEGRRERWRPHMQLMERANWSDEASAVVPIVPAGLHPGPALSNYHILWDAVWKPEPPRDPLLLKHLSGHLYAVVAHWDLSPLERAVLAGRL